MNLVLLLLVILSVNLHLSKAFVCPMNMSSSAPPQKSVLFVCLGNICRSPTAEAVFTQKVQQSGIDASEWTIDSCGTGGGSGNWYEVGGMSFHEGESSDARMTKAAAKRGIKLTSISRPLNAKDLEKFDLIVGMDGANERAVLEASRFWGGDEMEALARGKLRLMTNYCREDKHSRAATVPDPYYGGDRGFETVTLTACLSVFTSCASLI
ncbi:unnamed protein product [Chrysoparadoxa australica]